jgi:hypothetical protein
MNCANHPDRERVAFCQDCGKPLCQECTRTVGSAVYCEESLSARLAGGAPPGAYPGNATPNYNAPGVVPPPPPSGAPNPGLAALLGFIPGVGAMYNGQYAKGVVHLIVFAVLVSLADEHGIFGLFIAGWVCYQVIEAYHTARARRDGTPLPNPFGLNDLGERLGFGKSWPNTAGNSSTIPAAAPDAAATTSSTAVPPYPPHAAYPPPSQPGPNWNNTWESYAPPIPPVPPYATPSFSPDQSLNPATNRFPTGALWLIGLGALFLIGNSSLFHGYPVHRLIPFLLIGFGVWIFVHKMTDTGTGLADDGTPTYRIRLFCALRSSIWITLVGILFLLDSFDILTWHNSWPLLIITAGVMAIFRRVSYNPVAYPYPASPVAPAATPSTSAVPPNPQDKEGN